MTARIIFTLILAFWYLPAISTELTADKTVLITGSNRGIGLGLAREFAAQGWNVIATARNPASAAELQQLARESDNFVIEQLDVTDHDRIDELALKYQGQSIDVLLNNAAYIMSYQESMLPFDQIDISDTRQSFEVNVIGPMKLVQAFLPHITSSTEKKIINLSSAASSFNRGPSLGSSYNYLASKAALNMFTYTLAAGLRDQNVIVVALHPGVVETHRPGNDTSALPAAMRRIPRIDVSESAAKLTAVIGGLTRDQSGRFLSYENGVEIPW